MNFFEIQQDNIFVSNASTKIDSSKWDYLSDNYAVNGNHPDINSFASKKGDLIAVSYSTLNDGNSQVLEVIKKRNKSALNSNDKLTGLNDSLYRLADNERTELYTTEFVNSIKEAFPLIPKPIIPSTLNNCDCAEI